jgi:hypothetical protein
VNTIANLKTHIIIPFRLWKKKTNGESADTVTFGDFENYLKCSSWDIYDKATEQQRTEEERDNDRCRDYQAYSYFHPFVRRFWYDKNKVARFRRTDIKEFHVRPSGQGMPTVTFNVNLCELIRFEPNIGLLHVELESTGALPLNVVQACLDQVRRIYPPYFDKYQESWTGGYHYPLEVHLVDMNGNKLEDSFSSFLGNAQASQGERNKLLEAAQSFRTENSKPQSYLWAKHWQHLLQPLITDSQDVDGVYAIQLGDDRAGIASYIAFENIEHLKNLGRGNWVRLCFADAPGTDRLPYSRKQLGNFESRFCYDRFWFAKGESNDAPSRIMNCGYAFTWAGAESDTGYFSNKLNGAPAIFEEIYVPMAIIAHYLRAALLTASVLLSELSELSERDKEGRPTKLDRKAFENFYLHFIAFTQTFWFDEISPQEQAIKHFSMWREHLRIQELYDEVRQELKDATELINTEIMQEQSKQATKLAKSANDLAESAHGLTKIATIFAIPALAATLVSMFASLLALSSLKLPVELVPVGPLNLVWFVVFLANTLILFSVFVLIWAIWFFVSNRKLIGQIFQSGQDAKK